MRQPQISIVVPIYNVEKFIRQCLDSVVGQTYKNLEILLIDDGSPDNCGAICDEYAAKDSRIMAIHKENAGVSVARNDGIERATGEWIMFVDPDDWLALDCCAKVMEIAEKYDTDVIYFQIDINNEDGQVVREFPRIGSRILGEEDLERIRIDDLAGDVESMGFESGSPWGRVFKRDFLISNGCRFPVGVRRRQDLLFNLYCLEYLQSAYFYDYIGYHNRLNSNSICHRFNPDMTSIILGYLKEVEEYVNKYHKEDELYERSIGIQTINIQGDLRNTLFFNEAGYMPLKEYLYHMGMYYDDPVVKKYIKKVRVSDFRGFKDKLSFVLLSGEHVYLYYCIWAILRKIKSVLEKPLGHKTSM